MMLWMISALMLVWPVAWNSEAILFNDSIPYMTAGREAWGALARIASSKPSKTAAIAGVASTPDRAAGPTPHKATKGRSPFYGAVAWGARALGSSRIAAAVQAAWLAAIILCALRLLGISSAWARLGGVGVIAASTGLPFFAATIMPDVFAGVVPLSILLIWLRSAKMSRVELGFWCLNLTSAALFHASFALLGILLLGAIGVWSLISRRPYVRELAVIAGALGVAVAGMAVADVLAARVAKAELTPVPFLLARTVGDGTAARVLQQDCPEGRYVTCRYVPDLPLSENEFLWNNPRGTPWVMLPLDVRRAVADEERELVLEAVKRFPGEQLARSFANAATSIVTVNVLEFGRNEALELQVIGTEFAADMALFRQSRVWTSASDLRALSAYWKAIYLIAGAVALAWLAISRRSDGPLDPQVRATLIWLLAAVVLSAVEHGVLSGVMGRYTARISWLPTLVIVALTLHHLVPLRRSHPPAL